jgi:hypothetical protein
MPCRYNVTLSCVHVTIVVVESNKYYILCVCVCARARLGEGMRMRSCVCTSVGVCLRACRLTYPLCHAHAPYCLRPLWLHHIFRYYVINCTIFGKKKVAELKMCVLIFSTTSI